VTFSRSTRLICSLYLAAAVRAENVASSSAAGLASALHQISVDPKQTYRARNLELAHGDLKIYLNEGVLSFFTLVAGHRVAALFTTEGAEAGDAEVIVMPPQRSERASLASFAKSPNLDEHFTSALFLFSDNTAQVILDQLSRSPLREAPELAGPLGDRMNSVARRIAEQLDVRLVESLLDNHRPADGFFYSVIGGQTLGVFDVTFDPSESEPIFVGRVSDSPNGNFQLWTNFRSRRSPPFVPPEPKVHDYHIEATIRPELAISVAASFKLKTSIEDGRVISLALSPRLTVSSAEIDGVQAEVFQHPSNRLTEFGSTETFLLVSQTLLAPAVDHVIQVNYSGSIIRQTSSGEYFVDERSSWYPVDGPVLADFDLTFHCPARLRLVATGEPVSETVANGVRTVRRKTIAPAVLAGFNLGEYSVKEKNDSSYSIQIDSPQTAAAALTEDPTLPAQTAAILDSYTRRWMPLRIHSVAITPIAGYFGQGFPGLIYLSDIAYIKQESRAASLRNPRFDAFFSELLLPHEIAHQWWGNIVRQADYRSEWITEAMANQSALGYIERTKGATAREEILESYRVDLTQQQHGRTVESAGPVDFGQRLIDNFGLVTWQVILYEKGSWILHMLRQRLGDENFRRMQLQLLREYASRPLSNEEFRQVASGFVPEGEPDPSLTNFFDTWVYGTGIPGLALRNAGRTATLQVSGVENDFLAEIPLRCNGTPTYWVKAGSGDNTFELPKRASSCRLPSRYDFLYIPTQKD
jgi:Peptidase family M1 domain